MLNYLLECIKTEECSFDIYCLFFQHRLQFSRLCNLSKFPLRICKSKKLFQVYRSYESSVELLVVYL